MSALDANEIGQLFLPPQENNRDENSKSAQVLSDCEATSGDEEQVDHIQHFSLPPKASGKPAGNCRTIYSK